MDTPLPPAEELALIDRELLQLDARRAYLLTRRAWLVALLWQPGPAAGAPAPAQVKQALRLGVLEPGDRLPTAREVVAATAI
ncbi:hypothetical protein ABT143_11285, partial [Streptomyces sp. NPDC002033]|uniref:hypothetical protein n=1 Tax=Streptomyces sp. NPDC002033 TaxID=3154533 RepID=UPI003316FFDC